MRPSMQQEAHGKDLIPEGRGRAPCLQKDDLSHCCLELIVEDSPVCACLGVQIHLMDTLACYSSSHKMFLLIVAPSCKKSCR